MAQSDDPAERAKEIAAQAAALQAQADALQAEAEALKKAEALQAQAAALQAEAEALRQSTAAKVPVEPTVEEAVVQEVAVPAQPVAQQPQYVVQPAPVKQKGNGGLIGWLVTLSILLLASLAAIALIFFGIVNPRALLGLDAAAAPVATGTPVQAFLAPADAAGAGAFTTDALTILTGDSIALPATGEVPGDLVPTNVAAVVGSDEGLYGIGGATCARARYSELLAADSSLATPFVEALNADAELGWAEGALAVENVKDYVQTLMPVNLISDTLVTYYSLEGGAAVPAQAVLQKGTAVLADRYGVPRIRCISGNPLTQPEPDSVPVYAGQSWPDFLPEAVVAVSPAESALASYQARLPVSPTAGIVPLLLPGCDDVAAECAPPGPGIPVPPPVDGSTFPVPTPTECGSVNADNQESTDRVNARILNASDQTVQLFYVDSQCTTTWFDQWTPGYISSWSKIPWYELADQGLPRGTVFVVTNGTDSTILQTIRFDDDLVAIIE